MANRSKKRQFPRVFVGSSYGGAFKFGEFHRALNDLPFRLVFAKDRLDTRQILTNCRTLIRRADFCLFDVSLWNPNVTLELGLADGLGVQYYIMCRKSQARDVPADLKGLQRIQYNNYRRLDSRGGLNRNNLWYQVASQLAPKHETLARVWRDLGRYADADKRRLLAFRILAGLRDHSSLPCKRIDDYARGTRLQADAKRAVWTMLERKNLIRVSDRAIRATRRLFRPE